MKDQSLVDEALGRIHAVSQPVDSRFGLFIGSSLKDLESRFRSSSRWVETWQEGRELLIAHRESSQEMLVVVAPTPSDPRIGTQLRHLVEPLESALLPNPRLVLVGEICVKTFSLLQDLLFAHVVDWLPAEISEHEALCRLDEAWKKTSLRVQIFGLGLRSGAPRHTLTHQSTRMKYLVEPLGLDRLHEAPGFLWALRDDLSTLEDREELSRFLLECEIRERAAPERWASYGIEPADISKLGQEDLSSPEQRRRLLKCWAAYLAEVVAGIAETTHGDRHELMEFFEQVQKDFFPRRS